MRCLCRRKKVGGGGGGPLKSGDAIYRRIKNQLGPLRGAGVFERLGFESGRDDEIGGVLDDREWSAGWLERAHPGWSVEFILHVRVAVARATHEGGSADDVAASKRSDDFFAADSVLGGENGSIIEAAAHQAK